MYLHDYHGGWNQRWLCDGNEIVCKGSNQPRKNLRLDVSNGKDVGVYQRTKGSNQKWHCLGNVFQRSCKKMHPVN